MGLLDNDQLLLGLSLMQAGSAKPVRTGLGEGLLGSFMNVEQMRQQREDRALKQKQQALQEQQLLQSLAHQKFQQTQLEQQMARQNAIENLPSQFMTPGVKPNTMDNRDVGMPGERPVPSQGFDMAGYANAMFRYDPKTALALQQSLRKDTTPVKLGAGETLLDPTTFKPLVANPKEDSVPSAIKEYQFAVNQGYKGTFDQWDKDRKRAGATNVSLNTEKPLLNTVATGLGQQIDASLSNAKAASQAIGTAQAIKSAIDTGKVIAGPGASFRVAGLQIGQTLGIGGKDAAEILSNTRTAIQSMAKAELEAAQQMKGQGQITEAERDIIRRAASGDINSLTAGEMRLLADSMEKTARSKISQHKKNVEALGKMPNAAPILPFYQVDEPPAYQGSTGRVRRYNPQTGALE